MVRKQIEIEIRDDDIVVGRSWSILFSSVNKMNRMSRFNFIF